jgi:hypothetical protein
MAPSLSLPGRTATVGISSTSLITQGSWLIICPPGNHLARSGTWGADIGQSNKTAKERFRCRGGRHGGSSRQRHGWDTS